MSKKIINFQSLVYGLFIFFCLLLLPSSYISANPEIPKVRHSVKPLDLSRFPTTNELMAAGQLGGQLYPTEDIEIEDKVSPRGVKGSKVSSAKVAKFKRNKSINFSFGHAIQEWNRHNYKQAVQMFKKHVQDYPDSPWVSEAKLHVGCDARYNGRYTEAEDMFTTIIEKNKGSDHDGARMLLNKAKQRLGVLNVLQSNFDEALKNFKELKQDSPDWRHRTYASHWIQRLSKYKTDEMALLTCGTQALAHVLKRDGRNTESRDVMEIMPSSLKGHSIRDLKAIAERYGYKVQGLKITADDLKSVPLPAIVQISGHNDGAKGHYWVLEKINKRELMLFDPQSGRRFHQSPDEFSREWGGNAIVFSESNSLPGIRMTDREMERIYGACCGVPSPEGNTGDPDKNAADNTNKTCPIPNGAPIWKVNAINLNLFVTDIPIWYTPPIGPSVNIQLSYNSQSAIASNEVFGNKWQFNYGSYLVQDTGSAVTIFMPDGKRDVYWPDGTGGYRPPGQVFNELTQIAANHFELRFPDDTVHVYNIPSGTSSLQPFLVEIKDAYGQSLTFTYNTNVQLTTITDATGKTTTLSYNADDLVYQVTDPFGRSAAFEYDVNRNLTKITDMGGYWTNLDYDADVYLTKIEDQRGKWDFFIEPPDNLLPAGNSSYPPPGDNMWLNYRITVTNPLGGREEYFYSGGTGYSWYIRPGDYVQWFSDTENNLMNGVPRTEYYSSIVAGSIEGAITQKRYPDYPENKYISYGYDSDGNLSSVKDYYGNTVTSTYNDKGRITSLTDPKGFVTNMTYAGNNIDLIEIQNGLGTVTMTYNSAHDVTSITDRLGNTTTFVYNSYGQLTQSTDALAIVTGFTYDASNQLQQISRDGNILDNFTYDTVGRVDTHTNAAGVTLDYDYNDLNNVTKITYPDTKFTTYTYSGCCPRLIDSVTDRSGNTTNYTYDALKRIIEAIDPEGKKARYEYDANGNLAKLIDPNSNVTSFEYDLANRPVRKNFADGKYETYSYLYTGLVSDITNAREITRSYTYDQNYNLLTIAYSDSTPGITYTYNNYNRVTQRVDGIGTHAYTYDVNSRLTGMDGPWNNDTVSFQYNETGQIKNMIPEGGQSITYLYDTLGRLTDIQSGTGTHTYTYTGVNPLVQKLTRPNGSYTDHLYNDPLKRLTELTNKTSADAIINQHTFTYNNLDLIDTETLETGTPITSFTAGTKTYDYNNVNQLLNATNPSETFIYDDDGNMTQGYTPDGYVFTATHDAENRITSLTYNDGSIDHETKYFYSGDSMLAKVEKYENTFLTSEMRFVRAGFLPIQERDGTNAVTREYKWGLGMGGGIGGLLNLNQGGQDYSYLYNGKGNVMALTDSAEAIQAAYRYDALGNLKEKTGTLEQPYQFSTKRYDELTGLSYYGYRFYNPAIGRWMTRDPLGEAGGINLYGFVENNPVNRIDPLGLESPIDWYLPDMPHQPFPGYNYCGPGSLPNRSPSNGLDDACRSHDNCYGSAGMSSGDVDICDPGQDTGPSYQDTCDDALCSATNTNGGWIRPGVRYLFCD